MNKSFGFWYYFLYECIMLWIIGRTPPRFRVKGKNRRLWQVRASFGVIIEDVVFKEKVIDALSGFVLG